MVSNKQQMENYVAALETVARRKRAKRWRSFLGMRVALGVGVIVGVLLFVWHWIFAFDISPADSFFDLQNIIVLCVIGLFIIVRQCTPNKKKVTALENAAEADGIADEPAEKSFTPPSAPQA